MKWSKESDSLEFDVRVCGRVEINQHSSHARRVCIINNNKHWHKFPVTLEYSELLSYVTFLLFCCQLRVNCCSCASVVIFSNNGETNSLSQFSAVFSHQCVVQGTLHEFAFSKSCRVGCSSETLTHCVHPAGLQS